MKLYDPGTFHAWTGCHLRLYVWCNELEIEYMFSSLRLIPRQWQLSLWLNWLFEVSSIWFREILPQAGDFNQHTVAGYQSKGPGMHGCVCVSLFIGRGILDDHADRRRQGKSTQTFRYRQPWPLRQTSQTSLSPNQAHDLLTNSKSTLFCVGDQAEFVCIRGLIPPMISLSHLSYTPYQFCLWQLSLQMRLQRARLSSRMGAELACGALRDGWTHSRKRWDPHSRSVLYDSVVIRPNELIFFPPLFSHTWSHFFQP